jgi:hypothetical protein
MTKTRQKAPYASDWRQARRMQDVLAFGRAKAGGTEVPVTLGDVLSWWQRYGTGASVAGLARDMGVPNAVVYHAVVRAENLGFMEIVDGCTGLSEMGQGVLNGVAVMPLPVKEPAKAAQAEPGRPAEDVPHEVQAAVRRRIEQQIDQEGAHMALLELERVQVDLKAAELERQMRACQERIEKLKQYEIDHLAVLFGPLVAPQQGCSGECGCHG